MADDGFNGSTLTFPSTSVGQVELRSIDFSETAAKVLVSGSTSPSKKYADGIPDQEISCTIVGGTTCTVGSTGKVTAKWNDGSSDAIAACKMFSKATAGSEDGEILTTLTFAPA